MQEAGTVHRLEPGGFRTDICFLQKIIRKDIRVDIKAGMVAEKKDIEVFGTHESVRRVEVEEDRILLYVRPKAPEYVLLLDRLRVKIRRRGVRPMPFPFRNAS